MDQRRVLCIDNRSQYFVANRLELAKALRDRGMDVHVAAITWRHVDIDAIRSAKLVFHAVTHHSDNASLWNACIAILRLIRLCKTLQPDIIHMFTLKAACMGRLALRLSQDISSIMSITGLGYTFTAGTLKARCLRLAVRSLLPYLVKRSDHLMVFQNPDDLTFFQELLGLPNAQVHLIKGSGVDTKRYSILPESNGDPVVVLATRMLWAKGVAEFVEAAQSLKAQGVKARFVLVGDTDRENPAAIPREQLQDWHDKGVVEWWGYCEDMPSVFSEAHIVCLPSYYREGIPKVLIEAASCGRPIVTTDMPGCREIVSHGENGFLVPIRNSLALADALHTLIRDKALRQSMGQNGRLIVEREYAIEKVIEATFELYSGQQFFGSLI